MGQLVISWVTGAGKTTIWEKLSQKLKIPFFDIDNILKQRYCSKSIPDLSSYANVFWFDEYLKRDAEIFFELLTQNKKSIISTSWNTLLYEQWVEVFQNFQPTLLYLQIPYKLSAIRVLWDTTNFHNRIPAWYIDQIWMEEFMWRFYQKAKVSGDFLQKHANYTVDNTKPINEVVSSILDII